jgi:branched-chain amino acid transport system substrate-binding protein
VLLVFPACTGDRTTATFDEIKIGAVIPLTGRFAAGGEQIKNGYELAVDDINEAGGIEINGRQIPLRLVLVDDESDPGKTVQRMETLYANDQVLAYLGGFGSDLHAAAAAIAEKNQTPYIGVAFALKQIHEKGFKYLFSPFPKSPDMAKATFDILDTLSPKPSTIAIFAENTDWGNELRSFWQEEAQTRGYTIAVDESYAPGSKDFSQLITQAKAANVEVVLALPNPPDGLVLAKQMKELDFNASFYLFVRAPDSPTWSQNLGKDGDYFLLIPAWHPSETFPGVTEMVAHHQEKYGKPAQATTGPAYAAMQILADALQRAGTLDREAIREAIATTDMTTVIGPVQFNPDGTAEVLTVVNQYQNGKQILIWPPEQATATVLYPATPWQER